MAQVKDPVCGMMVNSDTAAAKSTSGGETYYFCSEQCRRQFDENPEKFVGTVGGR